MIIASGINVFVDKGVAEATVRDIIRATGLASGTFYNYFKSKETNHSYDESNEKSESIEEDKTAKEVKYIKYLKEK